MQATFMGKEGLLLQLIVSRVVSESSYVVRTEANTPVKRNVRCARISVKHVHLPIAIF